jgi:hypothetical protein
LPWSNSKLILEYSGKIGLCLDPYPEHDFIDQDVFIYQNFFGLVQPNGADEFGDRVPCDTLEFVIEVGFAHRNFAT